VRIEKKVSFLPLKKSAFERRGEREYLGKSKGKNRALSLRVEKNSLTQRFKKKGESTMLLLRAAAVNFFSLKGKERKEGGDRFATGVIKRTAKK